MKGCEMEFFKGLLAGIGIGVTLMVLLGWWVNRQEPCEQYPELDEEQIHEDGGV